MSYRRPIWLYAVSAATAMGLVLIPIDVISGVDTQLGSSGISPAHFFGTDHLGRDISFRTLVAVRNLIIPSCISAVVCVVVGLLFALSGLVSWVRMVLDPVGVCFRSIPTLILVLLMCSLTTGDATIIAAVVGPTVGVNLSAELGGRIAHLLRIDFVNASLNHGISPIKVILYHIIWVQCFDLLACYTVRAIGALIVTESALSYIGGFGIAEPQPSLGNMISLEIGNLDGNILAWAVPATALILIIITLKYYSNWLAITNSPQYGAKHTANILPNYHSSGN